MPGQTHMANSALYRALSDVDDETRSLSRQGLGALEQIPRERTADIVAAMLQMFEAGGSGEGELGKSLPIDSDDEESVATAFTLLGLAARLGRGTPEDVAQALLDQGLSEKHQVDLVIRILAAAMPKAEFLAALVARAALADALLPSISSAETKIDVRLGFKGANISVAVPIVLVRISTDVRGEELRFQMDKRQLGILVKQLQAALGRLEQAEALADKIAPTEKRG